MEKLELEISTEICIENYKFDLFSGLISRSLLREKYRLEVVDTQ